MIWGQTRYLGAGGANRGTDTTFGPGGWTFDPLDLSKRLSGGRGCPGTPGFGDRHDVRYADSERSTCNVQLSTFKNRGTDTTFGPGGRTFDLLDLSKCLSGVEATPGHPDVGTGTMFGMPIQNVQRATFNSQLSIR